MILIILLNRLWESMLLGTIPVLEKGIGLDKTVSIFVYASFLAELIINF